MFFPGSNAPSSSKKNEWSYTSTPSISLSGVHRGKKALIKVSLQVCSGWKKKLLVVEGNFCFMVTLFLPEYTVSPKGQQCYVYIYPYFTNSGIYFISGIEEVFWGYRRFHQKLICLFWLQTTDTWKRNIWGHRSIYGICSAGRLWYFAACLMFTK